MGPEMDANDDDQQFCLRWNNFQANITSQFETLRDDEDFTDVTIAVEGQRLQAHKVVLSACSPYFKELFKSNPCSHPIIFMRDVEARHVVALMEFMYAGEVNVAQAHLSSFLKTAESLKIRGLTDTSNDLNQRDDDTLFLNPQPLSSKPNATDTKSRRSALNAAVACSSTVTSSEDVATADAIAEETTSVPPSKRRCKTDVEDDVLRTEERLTRTEETVCVTNPFELDVDKCGVRPKIELPDYASDEERDDGGSYFHMNNDLTGGMEIIPQSKLLTAKDLHPETNYGPMRHRPQTAKTWSPFDLRSHSGSTSPDLMACLRDAAENRDPARRNRLVKLGEGIEIYEDQLRSVKWSDYRKLTRGLATILFSPAELATCSVTGQRWSRAGSGERPVKPALDRAKVQAIISYVATRFPMVEISRIKQVLAYKCKENSTAFKMKAVRYYGSNTRAGQKLREHLQGIGIKPNVSK